MITLEVYNRSHSSISELAEILSQYTDLSGVISAQVVSAEEMRQLNRDYAEKDESTDVLSFSYLEQGKASSVEEKNNNPQPSELGDIVISREHIESQAKAAGTDEDTEFLLLLTHGVLHILGYDHQMKEQRQKMDEIQKDVMRKLGRTYRDFGWQS